MLLRSVNQGGYDMRRLGFITAALSLGVIVLVGSAIVPVSSDNAYAATRSERIAARQATKSKRAECQREARAQKLGFFKRQRFVRTCMKRA
jgi:hypothetical protein